MSKRLPRINLKELKKAKEDNFRERLEFLDKYAEWVKNTDNTKWISLSQKALINRKVN